MRKIFVILFFISISVFAQEGKFTRITPNTTDFRNNVWYFGSTEFNVMDNFFFTFNRDFVKRTISDDEGSNLFVNLNNSYKEILGNLFNRGKGLAFPSHPLRTVIICDDKYGVMIFWWNDTSSFGNYRAGEKIMFRHFFELKSN
jgi:hypothetical protein